MGEKKCVSCGLIKNLSEFHKNKTKSDGLQDTCKICRRIKSQLNRDKRSEYRKEWYRKNSEHVKKMENDRYHSKKDQLNRIRREIYKEDIEYRKKIRDAHKNYYEGNKNKFRELSKSWAEKNKDKRNDISKRHYHKFKTLMICRRLIKRTIKYLGTKKEATTIELLGYSPLQLKESIEKKFKSGMTWENYGEWHIDHIRPISSFQLGDEPRFINTLENLQPLWAKENLSKGKKY
jgi:hypothetical protein